jgi:hypothetical protein
MNNVLARLTSKAVVILIGMIGLVFLGVVSRTSVSGNAGATQLPSQGVLGRGDNFVFTNASLKGTYGGVLNCTLVAGPVTGQCAVSYLYTADGTGNITNTNATVNINGQTFFDIDFPGTYAVSASGRVSMTVTPINGPLAGLPLPISSVVTETQGVQITELRGVDTAPGLVSTRVEKRIRK